MRHYRNLSAWLITLVLTFSYVSPISAFPPLPSSFYGIVQQGGQRIPDGTLVEALIDGAVMATSLTETYQGQSVYSLDVPGDDATTNKVEGGTLGQTIQFRIGGILADQTAIWASGVNQNLDLTLAAEKALAPTQPTFTPVPSQTPIQQTAATPTPTQEVEDAPEDEGSTPEEERINFPAHPTPTAIHTPSNTETQMVYEMQADGPVDPKDAISDTSSNVQDTNFVAVAAFDEQESESKIPKVPEEATQPAPQKNNTLGWILLPILLAGILTGYWILRRRKRSKTETPLL